MSILSTNYPEQIREKYLSPMCATCPKISQLSRLYSYFSALTPRKIQKCRLNIFKVNY